MRTFITVASALAVIAPLASAQTFTACNPMEKDCPEDAGLNQADYTTDFSGGLPKDWTATLGSVDATSDGGRFRIAKIDDGPTVQSNWHIFYGRVEVKLKAAPGAGIVSSIVLQSDNLDEIDWEWIGNDVARAQSNYFGKGNTTTYDRGAYHNVATPQSTWHTYAIDWTQEAITWLIDGAPVRTLKKADANGGKNYPQTPMNLRLGNWIGGKPGGSQGTIEWAGGLVDLSKAPFDMFVGTISVKNYNPASSYKFGDRSGSSASIQIIKDGKGTTITQNTGSNSGASSQPIQTASTSAVASVPISASAPPSTLSTTASTAPNVTLPTTHANTPAVVTPSTSPRSSIVPSNDASARFPTQAVVLGSGLIAVMSFFMTL